jgi:hypothetical protein
MKKGIKKLTKGVFAILTIKLLFVGLLFMNQACQSDIDSDLLMEKENALSSLEESVKEVTPYLKLEITKYNIMTAKQENKQLLTRSYEEKFRTILNP